LLKYVFVKRRIRCVKSCFEIKIDILDAKLL